MTIHLSAQINGETMMNQKVPAWVALCLALAATTAYDVVIFARGHAPDGALNGALAIILLMTHGIVARATRDRPKPEAPKDQVCSSMRVIGRHDGVPCASCEIEGASITRRF